MSTKESTLERTVVIENMEPCIDGGRFPVKRIVGQELKVSADVSKNGHDQLSVVLKWRKIGKPDWHQTPMAQTENDRWEAACHFIENAQHEYTVEAWEDAFKSWQVEYAKKYGAGNLDLRLNWTRVLFLPKRLRLEPRSNKTKSDCLIFRSN